MTAITYRPATYEDARSLAPRLRPADALELRLAGGPDLEATLMESISISDECFVALEGDLVVALCGVSFEDTGEMVAGCPWMVGSTELLKYPVEIVRKGSEKVAEWGECCDLLFNFTHEGNKVHHRWLKHIGFEFVPGTTPMGPEEAPFRQFFKYSRKEAA